MEEKTAQVQIAPQSDPGVAALVTNIGELLKYAQERTITSQEDVAIATADLTIISNLKKQVATKREEYTRPLMTHLDTVRGTFKTIEGPLLEADKILREKVLEYQAGVRRKAEEAERIAEAERKLAEEKAALNGTPVAVVETVAVEQPKPTTKGELGDSGQMMVAKFEIEDFAKLPDKYKLPNEVLIGKLVRAGETDIPGVRIWKEPTLAIRRKSTTGKV